MPAAAELPQIVIIDDEMGPRESLRMLLKPNYQVFTAENVESGVQLVREKHPDVVISDIRMPGTSGIDGLRKIREIDPHVAVIMLTGFGALDTAKEALRLGANDYISKPFDAREMRDVIARNVERTRVKRSSELALSEIQELNQRLMREIAQKERLASLGQASAEFVHDLSNPLTIVWGYVQLLAKKLEQNGDAAETSPKELSIIEQNVRLCRELLTMWQSYGSDEGMRRKAISICEIVRNVVKSAENVAAQSGVEVSVDVPTDSCTLIADAVQIQRALQNVVINAIQAAAETRGRVEVSCAAKEFYIDVRVHDTGPGIAQDQIPKIFDPYFTTKQSKSGTGLGLYITRKVVEDHSGSIKVDSAPGQGTTFTIRLPVQNG
jgi:two-component system sensor histidine kinase/response regulator